jgi:hypothetical protein
MSSALDLWRILEKLGAEISNNMTTVKNMLKECLTLNFIPLKFTELQADKFLFNKIHTITN